MIIWKYLHNTTRFRKTSAHFFNKPTKSRAREFEKNKIKQNVSQFTGHRIRAPVSQSDVIFLTYQLIVRLNFLQKPAVNNDTIV